MRIARSFRPRRALKRDSEKSTEGGGSCKSCPSDSQTANVSHDGDARASAGSTSTDFRRRVQRIAALEIQLQTDRPEQRRPNKKGAR